MRCNGRSEKGSVGVGEWAYAEDGVRCHGDFAVEMLVGSRTLNYRWPVFTPISVAIPH